MRKLFERDRKTGAIIMDRTNVADWMGECSFCGQEAELRPYGPNREEICYECAMKDEETTTRVFCEIMEEQTTDD